MTFAILPFEILSLMIFFKFELDFSACCSLQNSSLKETKNQVCQTRYFKLKNCKNWVHKDRRNGFIWIRLDFKKPFLTLESAFEHCLLPRMHLSLFIYLPLPCLPSITVLVCTMQKMTQNARKIQFRNPHSMLSRIWIKSFLFLTFPACF